MNDTTKIVHIISSNFNKGNKIVTSVNMMITMSCSQTMTVQNSGSHKNTNSPLDFCLKLNPYQIRENCFIQLNSHARGFELNAFICRATCVQLKKGETKTEKMFRKEDPK